MRKKSVLWVCSFLILSYGILIPTPNASAGSLPPPDDGIDGLQYIDGDWNVNGVESYTNETIVLTGNLTVENGGRLTLKNVTLIMNSTAGGVTMDDFFHIEVKKGGTMYILDYDNDNTTRTDASNITLNDTAAYYWFWVRDGSNFTMKNSELHEGGGASVASEGAGIMVYTDNATIDHNLISNNRYGVVLYGSDAVVSNNTIEWNDHTGIYSGYWSNATIENNWIDSNWVYGIWVTGGSNSDPKPSNPLILRNTIINTGRGVNTADGLQIEVSSAPIIKDTKVIASKEDGMYMWSLVDVVAENLTIDPQGGNYAIVGGGSWNRLSLTNSTIGQGTIKDVSIAQSYFTFTNTTFDPAGIRFDDSTSNLTVNWFLNTYVNDIYDYPIEGVIIRIRDNDNGTYDRNFTTEANGYLNWTVVALIKSKYITITLGDAAPPDPEYNISLQEGWNLVSLPLEQSNESIDQTLSSITGKWDCIQAYEAINDIWLSNATFKPDQLNDFSTLNHKMGFWINITVPNVNLTVRGHIPGSTSISLYTGWNLVGYPTMSTETVANALWGTGADKVEVFDPGEPYLIREVGPTYVMKPGEGYWVHVPVDTTWIIDW